MDWKRLLDPKGSAREEAKDKVKKRAPNYGPQQTRKAAHSGTAEPGPSPTTFKSKALLDPHTINGKPKSSASSDHKSSPIRFDPKALLAPKSSAGRSKASASDSQDVPSSLNMNTTEQHAEKGMGDYISRLNNLNNRAAPLPSPLKRKSDNMDGGNSDDEERAKAKAKFTGTGGTGEIGAYMKAQREKGAAESGSQAEPVDFTNEEDGDANVVGDGDDEVIITGTNILPDNRKVLDNTEVCLGMLHSQALVWMIPNGPRFQTSPLGKGWWPQTRVNYRRSPGRNNFIELFSKTNANGGTGIKFGNLDGKLASVLCPLLDGLDVNKMRLKFFLDAFEKKPGDYPGQRTSRSLKIRVIVYAPRQRVPIIAKSLSQKQMFLTDPIMVENGIEYENPHNPKMFGPAKALSRSKPQNAALSYVTRTQEEILRETSDMFDSLVKSEDLPEKDANGELILTPLMAHQKQALHFMTEHERDGTEVPDDDANFSLWKTSQARGQKVWYNVITNQRIDKKPEPTRGGILADVMGLGKTLSILALIAETRNEASEFGARAAPIDDEGIECNSKATLIICPKSVMANWHEQIKAHTKTKYFKVYSYHGTNRTENNNELAQYDVVLAPYQTAASEFSNARSKKKALASINWFRIVLDEAHMIRNGATGVSKACCSLSAQRRWAVTGTPVQNRLDDLGALIKFLRIKPFDEGTAWSQYIIGPFRAASEHVITHLRLLVDSITLRRMKDKIGLKDRKQIRERLDFSDEEMAIYSRFAKESNRQLRVMLMESGQLRGKSYAHVLKSLGRLRAICAHGREMLSEDDQRELDGLTAATAIDLGDEPDENPDESFIGEKLAYDTFTMMTESEVDGCIGCGRKVGEQKDNGDADVAELDNDSDSEDESDESSIDEEDTLGYLTPCFHLLCPKCKDDYIEDTRSKLTIDHYHTCAYCEQYVRWGLFELTRPGLKAMLEARSNKNKKGKHAKWDESTYSGPHTKVKALLQDLEESQRETAQLPSSEPPIRSVVFSGWTTYLDLIEYALEEHQIGFVRLDGSMSVKARSAVLQTFNSDPTITVLLVSIKAGGQGLNFTSANKVYMMEPQFNPGVETQAIDRVHRLGQKRDVFIKHFIMKESVEEKILVLQEKKEKLARLSMERKLNRSEEAKQRLQELKDLFK